MGLIGECLKERGQGDLNKLKLNWWKIRKGKSWSNEEDKQYRDKGRKLSEEIIKIGNSFTDPHPEKSDKLDPDLDPHQFADGKSKCMEYDPILYKHFSSFWASICKLTSESGSASKLQAGSGSGRINVMRIRNTDRKTENYNYMYKKNYKKQRGQWLKDY